jgi:hypothetical protein
VDGRAGPPGAPGRVPDGARRPGGGGIGRPEAERGGLGGGGITRPEVLRGGRGRDPGVAGGAESADAVRTGEAFDDGGDVFGGGAGVDDWTPVAAAAGGVAVRGAAGGVAVRGAAGGVAVRGAAGGVAVRGAAGVPVRGAAGVRGPVPEPGARCSLAPGTGRSVRPGVGARCGVLVSAVAPSSLEGLLVTKPDRVRRDGPGSLPAAAGADTPPSSSTGASGVLDLDVLATTSSARDAWGPAPAGSSAAVGRRSPSRSAFRRTRSA